MLSPDQPGLVVAHGLGSGKTLTSIAAQDALGMPASVVLPAALQENYAKERAKHLTGDTQPADMTTLQAIARRGEPPAGRLLIVDEAHRIRDASSKGSQALRRSAAEKRMLLTATPFYNAASDVAPLINVAAGRNVLPNDPNEFYGRYVTDQVVMPSWWGRNIRHETPGIVEKVNPKTAPALRATFAKYMDYHPSSQEGFPSVERKDVKVEMSPEQLKIYDAMLGEAPPWVAAKIRAGLPPSKREAQELNAFMGAVRQVSNTTGAYAPDADVHQPKIEQAFQNLQQYLGENERAKAVVYSNYLESGLHPYAQKLQEAGIPHGMFTGEMKQHERDQMVRDYNEGKLKALLLSSAGGEGLDLKGTRLMQVLDPHWNEEKLRQVEGRGVRYGSHADLPEEERKVLIERYLATRPRSGVMEKLHLKKPGGSVDEYLTNLSGEKERLHEQFRQLMPGYEKTSSVEKRALIERLVRLGATDIPSTPRLFMRHRSPEELATLQHAVEHAYDARVTNPLMGVIQKATGKLPAGKLRTVVDKGARLVAEDPVGTLAANLVPVPGAHPAYVAGKKLLEKGIDTAFPVPTLTPKLAELAEDGKHELQGHLKFQGLRVAVENKKGSVRSGTTPDGHKWRTVMKAPYGYLEVPAKGKDGEGIDVYVGPDKKAPDAFVVHQHKPDGTGHDEDKVMLGFRSLEEAKAMYLKHYDDPKFLGPISTVPVEELKKKLQTDDRIEKISAAYLLKQSMEVFDSHDKAREVLQPGDVLVTRAKGTGPTGRLFAKTLESAQSSKFYHSAMYVGDGKVVHTRLGEGITEVPLDKFHDMYQYRALRVNAPEEDRDQAARFAKDMLQKGKPYDAAGLLRTFWKGEPGATEDRKKELDKYICSSLIAAAYPDKVFQGRGVQNTRPVDIAKSKHTSLIGQTIPLRTPLHKVAGKERQVCLRATLDVIDKNPSLKMMTGPADKKYDSRHFWAVDGSGKVHDPTRSDYAHYDKGVPFDTEANKDFLNGLRKTAEDQSVSVGYASATVQPRGEDGVTVEKLWVDPEHRGKGEARKLMERIKDQFADKDIWLKPRPFGDMEAPLEVLKEFYKTMGFEVMDKQDNMRLPRRKEQSRG